MEHPTRGSLDVSRGDYTWIYALSKDDLADHGILLRSGRTHRRPHGRARLPGARIVGITSIDARPADAADRAVPGPGRMPRKDSLSSGGQGHGDPDRADLALRRPHRADHSGGRAYLLRWSRPSP
jgi:hypothetical protein